MPDLNAPGWSDVPPSSVEGLTDGLQLHDPSHRGRARGARRVYHGALVDRLREEGSQSVEELVGGMGWFTLRMTEREVRQVVESARRFGLVTAAPPGNDAFGSPIRQEWTLTAAGQKLSIPRGSSALDFGDALMRLLARSSPLRETVKAWWPAATTVAVALGLKFALDLKLAGWLILAPVLVLVAMGLWVTGRNDWQLTAAAKSWPRLGPYRPARYCWETRGLAPRLVSALALEAAAVLGAIAIVEGHPTWAWLSAAVIFGLRLILYWWWPSRRAFHREERYVESMRAESSS